MTFPIQKIQVISPRMVMVEVHDAEITLGALTTLGSPDAGAYYTWLSRSSSYAYVVGPDKMHLRFQDTAPSAYLNYTAMQVAGNWADIGNASVTAVYYKNNAKGEYQQNADPSAGVQMFHRFYLELDADLEPGAYTITPPAAANVTAKQFIYSDRHSVVHTIHVNQMGYRMGGAKIAYFSVWVPGYGTTGDTDFLADFYKSTFYVLDENNQRVYTGTVDQRLSGADDEEEQDYIYALEWHQGAAGFWLSPNAIPFATVTGLSATNPAVCSYSGTDPANGDRIFFDDVFGFTDANYNSRVNAMAGHLCRVANVNAGANTFQIERWDDVGGTYQWVALNATASTGNPNTDPNSAYGSGGKIYHAYQSNNPGTSVYGLDFSDFVPAAAGRFRLQVPGFGVSYEFPIDPAAPAEVAKLALKGSYHQRSGMLLDGRFGYTRPANEQPIFKSKLPHCFCSESHYAPTPTVQQNLGPFAPYVTATSAHDGMRHGYHDAGDWDTRLTAMDPSFMIDVNEQMTVAQRAAFQFGTPLASELGSDLDYSLIDNESDLLHEAVFALDGYRRAQEADGGVSNGINIGNNDASGNTDILPFEPSWLYRGTYYSYKPDHGSSFWYAHHAARLAKVFQDRGYTTLATTWRTSAIAAFDFAEAIYTDATTRNNYFATFKTAAGWSDAQYNASMATVQAGVKPERAAALGALFLLTDSSTYKTAFHTEWDAGYLQDLYGQEKNGPYAYWLSPNADSTRKAEIATQFQSLRDRFVTAQAYHIGYMDLSYGGHARFGNHYTVDLSAVGALVRYHFMTGDTTALEVLDKALAMYLGGNQLGICSIKGGGYENTKRGLHQDSYSSGQEIPDGIGFYGPVYGNSLGVAFNNFGRVPYFFFKASSEGVTTYENHQMRPWVYSRPPSERIPFNRYLIEIMEYTVEQNVHPIMCAAAALSIIGGNESFTLAAARSRTARAVTY